MKTDLLQSCGHCWVFQICWHIECSTFIASSFRIWNRSTGIPSPPLALFVVMLSKATWLHIPGCLVLGEWSHHRDYLGHEDLFLYSSSVYSCHLFLISSASVRSIPFLSIIEPIFAWNVPLVSLIFMKRSLVSRSHQQRRMLESLLPPLNASAQEGHSHFHWPKNFTMANFKWNRLMPSPLCAWKAENWKYLGASISI